MGITISALDKEELVDVKLSGNSTRSNILLDATYHVVGEYSDRDIVLKGIHISDFLCQWHIPCIAYESSTDSNKLEGKIIFGDERIKVNDIQIKNVVDKPKDMTIEEIEKALGHPVRIVGKFKEVE